MPDSGELPLKDDRAVRETGSRDNCGAIVCHRLRLLAEMALRRSDVRCVGTAPRALGEALFLSAGWGHGGFGEDPKGNRHRGTGPDKCVGLAISQRPRPRWILLRSC